MLAEVETGRIRKENGRHDHAERSKRHRKPELGAGVHVVENDGGKESAELAASSGKAVCEEKRSVSEMRPHAIEKDTRRRKRRRKSVERGRSGEEERRRTGRGTDRGGEALASYEERNAVRSKLVPEGGEMVHELERGDRRTLLRELRVEDGGEEVEEEVPGESDLLHAATTVQLVVDEEEGEVVSDHRNGDVDLRGGKV